MLPSGKLKSKGQNRSSLHDRAERSMNKREKQPESSKEGKNLIYVARYKDLVLIRVSAMGTMNNSVMMLDFAHDMIKKGYHQFVLDMGTCSGMDSTFMGALLDISFRTQEAAESGGKGTHAELCLLNVSSENLRLLQMLGVDRFVRFGTGINIPPIEMTPLTEGILEEKQRLEVIKRAHQHLVRVDKSNEQRFGAFLDILCKELDNIKKSEEE